MRRCSLALLSISAFTWAATTVFYFGVWDQVAAITTFPQWSWALTGMLITAIAWRLQGTRTRLPALLLALWLLTALAFSDNLIPLLRGLVRGYAPGNAPSTGAIRVVTLNCASSTLAAGEVMRFKPDIVLLQESPTSNEVVRLAREWFGDTASIAVGLDCAILSRHPMKPTEERPPVHYTRARLIFPINREILITSLRFTPPLGTMDLWKPATWRAYTQDRRLRKSQMQSVLEDPSMKDAPLQIIGGDFNAPAGDGIYGLLHGFRDAHRTAGCGWGHTALNTIPLFRPDQIWLKGLTPISAHAIRTVHSDHRIVIADVRLESN